MYSVYKIFAQMETFSPLRTEVGPLDKGRLAGLREAGDGVQGVRDDFEDHGGLGEFAGVGVDEGRPAGLDCHLPALVDLDLAGAAGEGYADALDEVAEDLPL